MILVTEENKSTLPPEYEVGDVVYSVEVANYNGFKSAVYVSIGKDWVIGETAKNTIHTSFFEGDTSIKTFKTEAFNSVVAVPIFKLFEYLNKTYGYEGPTIFYIANLPEGVGGRTYSGTNSCVNSFNGLEIVLDSDYIINPLNERFNFTKDQLSLLDDVLFRISAHESFHALMGYYGILGTANMRIGAEAFAEAYGLDALEVMRYFYRGWAFGEAKSAYNSFISNKAKAVFKNHIINMSTTSSSDSGYEHFFLVWYMMSVSNMSWNDIFNELSDYKKYCQVEPEFSPTLFQYLFNHQVKLSDKGPHPFPYTYLAYLGHFLQNKGGYLPEIFDPIRSEFENITINPLPSGLNLQIPAKNFIPFTVSRDGLVSDEYLVFDGDNEMQAAMVLTNGELVILSPGDVIFDRNSSTKDIIVFNPEDSAKVVKLKRFKFQPQKLVLPIVSN